MVGDFSPSNIRVQYVMNRLHTCLLGSCPVVVAMAAAELGNAADLVERLPAHTGDLGEALQNMARDIRGGVLLNRRRCTSVMLK